MTTTTIYTDEPIRVAQSAPPAKSRKGLVITGIVVGAVIAAGALFGGGVAVGAAVTQSQIQSQFGNFPQGGFGGQSGDGTRPQMPGQGQSDTDTTQP